MHTMAVGHDMYTACACDHKLKSPKTHPFLGCEKEMTRKNYKINRREKKVDHSRSSHVICPVPNMTHGNMNRAERRQEGDARALVVQTPHHPRGDGGQSPGTGARRGARSGCRVPPRKGIISPHPSPVKRILQQATLLNLGRRTEPRAERESTESPCALGNYGQ